MKIQMDFVRLWMHEASRVYADKLIEEKDIETFTELKFKIAMDNFEVWYIVRSFPDVIHVILRIYIIIIAM